MIVRDTAAGYGIVSRVLHWGMALAVFLLFAIGWWMVGLDYYSPYYKTAPDFHRSLGLLLLFVLMLRMAWRMLNITPRHEHLTPFERRAASAVHRAFYALLAIVMISGYFISTADGRPIDVFGWFSVPALVESKGLEDGAGLVHKWLAYAVMFLAAVHSAAALKHLAIDGGPDRLRMWRGPN
jgi:cytochrome b561